MKEISKVMFKRVIRIEVCFIESNELIRSYSWVKELSLRLC